MATNVMQVTRPKPFVSTRGTMINNTAGLNANQMQRIRSLADSGYGTKAQALTNKWRTASPLPDAVNTSDSVSKLQNILASQAAGQGTGNGTTATPGGAPVDLNAIQNTPSVPPTGGGNPVNKTQNPTGGKQTPWVPGSDLDTLNRQKAHIEASIAARKAKGIASPNDTKRLAAINKALAGIPSQPTVSTPTDTGTNTGATAGQPPPDTGDSNNTENGVGNILFPSERAMEPSNYEGSPLYKWQQQEGQTALNRVLAKRGLLNSGAEIEANSRFQQGLGASEANTARGIAQNEADRLERVQQNESLRRERQGNNASDNAYRWTQLLLGQNPMNYAMEGTNSYANTLGKDASTMANYFSQIYPHASGGGGGGGVGPYQAPFPTGPNFDNINILGSLMNGSSNNNFANGVINSLPALFDPKNWA